MIVAIKKMMKDVINVFFDFMNIYVPNSMRNIEIENSLGVEKVKINEGESIRINNIKKRFLTLNFNSFSNK